MHKTNPDDLRFASCGSQPTSEAAKVSPSPDRPAGAAVDRFAEQCDNVVLPQMPRKTHPADYPKDVLGSRFTVVQYAVRESFSAAFLADCSSTAVAHMIRDALESEAANLDQHRQTVPNSDSFGGL